MSKYNFCSTLSIDPTIQPVSAIYELTPKQIFLLITILKLLGAGEVVTLEKLRGMCGYKTASGVQTMISYLVKEGYVLKQHHKHSDWRVNVEKVDEYLKNQFARLEYMASLREDIRYGDSPLLVEFRNGSILQFKGADDDMANRAIHSVARARSAIKGI